MLARVRKVRCLLTLLMTVVLVSGATAASTAPVPLALKERMLKAGEFPGFVPPPVDEVQAVTSPQAWSAGGAGDAAEVKRLRGLGFVAAAIEHLTATRLVGRDAISVVLQFRTVAGARADVAHTLRTYAKNAGMPITQFAVPGIPGSRQFVAKRPDGLGYDVVFSDGAYSYDVGAFTPDPKGRPTRAEVAAAARRLYQRVHGHPAG